MLRGIRASLFILVLWGLGLTTNALAQDEEIAPAGPPGAFDNLPPLTWLLVPLLMGGAAAISYWLHEDDGGDKPRRREGPISRMLARGHRAGAGRAER